MHTKPHPLLFFAPANSFLLDQLAQKYGTDKHSSQNGYTWHYHLHFDSIRTQPLNILELGIFRGSSLRMWRDYFPNSNIYGIDIAVDNNENRIFKYAVDLNNSVAIDTFISNAPVCFDIIIDDASHHMTQQQLIFNKFFPVLSKQGIFVIEDLCTSYCKFWGGGYRNLSNTIEFIKEMLDCNQHEAYRKTISNPNNTGFALDVTDILPEPPTYLEQNIYSIYLYKYLCFIYKGNNY